jgi:hypothetical protein
MTDRSQLTIDVLPESAKPWGSSDTKDLSDYTMAGKELPCMGSAGDRGVAHVYQGVLAIGMPQRSYTKTTSAPASADAQQLAQRAVLRGRQRRVRLGPLPGAAHGVCKMLTIVSSRTWRLSLLALHHDQPIWLL